MPKRIQRKRTKGWRMPLHTKYVGRGSAWGNPYVIDEYVLKVGKEPLLITSENCLELFEDYARLKMQLALGWLAPLWKKNLACWCREGEPCHADILLRLANGGPK